MAVSRPGRVTASVKVLSPGVVRIINRASAAVSF